MLGARSFGSVTFVCYRILTEKSPAVTIVGEIVVTYTIALIVRTANDVIATKIWVRAALTLPTPGVAMAPALTLETIVALVAIAPSATMIVPVRFRVSSALNPG